MEVGNCQRIQNLFTMNKTALSLQEIQEKIKERKKAPTISKAIKHQNRLRLHTEPYLDQSKLNQTTTEYLEWVKEQLPRDKYKMFLDLFRFPLQTVELSESIYSALEKIFESRNSVNNYYFQNPELKQDWQNYRKDVLKEPYIWRNEAWQIMKTSINSMIVVDLPQEQIGEMPEPYYYFLQIEKVIDYCFKKDNRKKLSYCIFSVDESKIACYDETFYRVFEINSKNEITNTIVEAQHYLGYCPVQFFWNESIAINEIDIKKAPITSQLNNFDWSLFYAISKRILDMYGAYPIYSAYEADCDYENNDNNSYCDGGYLRNLTDSSYYFANDGGLIRCPKCSDKRIVGVGSFLEVPIPQKDQVNLQDPVKITTIDVASLEYNVKENKRVKEEIYISCVGDGGGVEKKEAVNVEQIRVNVEDRTTILINLKKNFEYAMTFANDTVCRLRYGDMFIGSSVNLGTEFYIYSLSELREQYNRAKESGANESELDRLAKQIVYTEYKNNPDDLKRQLLLYELEPYKNYTRNELLQLKSQQLLDDLLYKIKINFVSFVERFERENIDIVQFGSQIDYDKKIQIINEKFKDYAREGETGINN